LDSIFQPGGLENVLGIPERLFSVLIFKEQPVLEARKK
jgi:hypothetical protein